MAPRKNFDHLNDPLADALGVVGEWWTPLVLTSIAGGSHHFEEIQAALGIARNILTDRLTTLVANEVVEKRQYSDKPKRYEYHLTKKGKDVLPAIELLAQWGAKWVTSGKHN
jgi:DNA-binding HxlR family transcriptional regulator